MRQKSCALKIVNGSSSLPDITEGWVWPEITEGSHTK